MSTWIAQFCLVGMRFVARIGRIGIRVVRVCQATNAEKRLTNSKCNFGTVRTRHSPAYWERTPEIVIVKEGRDGVWVPEEAVEVSPSSSGSRPCYQRREREGRT